MILHRRGSGIIEREVGAVDGTVLLVDVTYPYRCEIRDLVLRGDCVAIAQSVEGFVGVTALGRIPEERDFRNPDGDEMLLLRVDGHGLAIEHRLEDRLDLLLKFAHTPVVAFFADGFRGEPDLVENDFRGTGTLQAERSEVLPFQNPLRPNVLAASRRRCNCWPWREYTADRLGDSVWIVFV